MSSKQLDDEGGRDVDESTTGAGVENVLQVVDETAAIDVARLFARVEQALLGGPRRWTPEQVAERAGVSRDQTRALWRALGFATVSDDDAVYTDIDVEAVGLVEQLRAAGFEDDQLVTAMSRLFGQTFSRLASWQGQLMLEMLADRPELLASEETLVELIDEVGPLLEQLQTYAWRRQLVAFFARAAARASDDVATSLTSDLAIGFVDMSGFTALTRRLSEPELRDLLERFESLAATVVGSHGGRVVKTIGDEVLFQSEDAVAAAEIALEMVETAGEEQRASRPARGGRDRPGRQPARRRLRLHRQHRQPAHLDLPSGNGAGRPVDARRAGRRPPLRPEVPSQRVGARLSPPAGLAAPARAAVSRRTAR